MVGQDIGANATTIAQLLSEGRMYRIPVYQRSYSWRESDALGLLHDLLEAMGHGRSHFLGAIVTIESQTPDLFEVVDGQQRLTTLSLIIAILRDLTANQDQKAALQSLLVTPDGNGSWRLTLNHNDARYFRSLLQKPPLQGPRDIPDPQTESQEYLRGNHAALLQELSELELEQRDALATLLLYKSPVIQVDVKNRDEGYRVFQVLNTRGRQPSAHDILKTELFERANFSSEQADRFARDWTSFEARLGAKDFDDLLRQIRLLHDSAPKGDLVSGFCTAVLQDISAEEFLQTELPRYVDAFAELRNGTIRFNRPMPQVNSHLSRLRALEHSGWHAPALKFLVTHSRDADTAREFFCDLERLGYAMQLIVSDRDARPKRYRRVCDEISSDRALFSKTGALSLTPEERLKLAQRLTGRFGSVSQRRALCMKLNSLLPNGEDLSPEDDATVEHILPRSIAQGSPWLKDWPNLVERRELADTVGNFCLLTKRDNQKADRMSFHEKRTQFFEDAAHGGQFALTRDASKYESWTPQDVKNRTRRLVDLLIKDWKLDLRDG